jgi:hypothetical protein
MVRTTFRSVQPGMGKDMYGAAGRWGDDRTGEAIATRRTGRGSTWPTTEMGEAACSGRATLYGGAV